MLYTAPNQTYTKKYLAELKDKYGIIYDGKGCFAFKVIPRKMNNPLVQILAEDDGNLFETDIKFDIYWIKDFINNLQAAQTYADKINF